MASNPPFQAEDLTDEDFFDKLVDDDDDNIGPTVTEGNESDDARAFANLTIGEDSGEADNFNEKENDPVDAGAASASAHADGDPVDAGAASASAHADGDGNDSLGVDNSVIDSNNLGEEVGGSEVGFDPNLTENSGSMNSGVKEVGWNLFYADSNENGVHGFGSYSDFFHDLGDNSMGDFPGQVDENTSTSVLDQSMVTSNGQVYGTSITDDLNALDMNSSQYWENMYPGWKYDANTGMWYQVHGYEGNLQGNYESLGGDGSGITNNNAEVSYLQQTVQSVAGTLTTEENSATESVAYWNQISQVNNGYPEHMYFDPQYPGYYYDKISQEWRTLESYTTSFQPTVQGHDLQNQNGFASSGGHSLSNSSSAYNEYGPGDNYGSQGFGNPSEHGNWGDSYGNYSSTGLNMWQPGPVSKSEPVSSFAGNQQLDTAFGSNISVNNHVNHFKSSYNSLQEVQSLDNANQVHTEANGVFGLRTFVSTGNIENQFNQSNINQNDQMHFSNNFYGGQKSVNAAQQPLLSSQQFPYASNTGRSSAGRPPHALVTFGFGGKLIVMKDSTPLQNSSFGTQDSVGASISVLNLLEVVNGNINFSGVAAPVACDYFRALCQQSFPGPLVGGNVGSKELNKWIDDRIASCESPDMEYKKGEVLRLLLSLLKIACHHYGKLRSPFGADTLLKDSDTPESAVAQLFASTKRKESPYGALSHCLQQFPSEGQIRATALEVQNLLVSGRKKEALQCAQQGQLWGPALVLASQLGDQFYVDTVKLMALHQLVSGSPLRTLCLLIAGQPAEVFSTGNMVDSMVMPQQHAQLGANCMLEDWEENLAVITANRTKDDELVIIHLGDCLWKERSETTAAHICYLIAEANFEAYSDSARLCLIGADHLKFPRTYASPEAIQRTELYEYSKVLGNSQFILLPFQPYKLIYAHMLAEVGRVSDSLKYCQAVLKSLKTGRASEVESWKQLVSSLEDRIRIHQQGGYAANAPAKLVGKLLNFFDSTAHRVVGGLPPPGPAALNGNSQGSDYFNQQTGPRVSASQSSMAISSMMSSASKSMEPINDWAGKGADGKMTMHYRSVSEPNFGRSPGQDQVDSSKEAGASTAQGKSSISVGTSRFARFGFGSQLLQKTMGLVLRPHSDKQAKLGETNKFYYDEKLKRWVEEGAEPPAEEPALAPPPTSTSFQNGMPDNNLKSALKSEGSPPNGSPTFRNSTSIASGIPPIPTASNQFSARGRMGVRARYVDTFNKGGGGGQANLFQSPAVPSVKPAMPANAKFFIPTPAPTSEQTMEAIAESAPGENATSNNPTTSNANNESYQQSPYQQSPPMPSVTMQRFPSMDNIAQKKVAASSLSRRTASWSGSNFGNASSPSPPPNAEIRPLGEALGMPPPSYFMQPSPVNNGNFGDELHEVEL